MSNEATKAPSSKPEPRAVERRDPERVPLTTIIWERTMQHLPGNGAGVSMTHCGRPPENTGMPHYMGDWLPLAQVIELHWYQGDDQKTPTKTVRIPIRHALQFE